MEDDSARWLSVLEPERLPPLGQLVEVCLATPNDGDPLFMYGARYPDEESHTGWSWRLSPPCGIAPNGPCKDLDPEGCTVTHHRRLPRVPKGFDVVRDALRLGRE